jgi:hypothetical protein
MSAERCDLRRWRIRAGRLCDGAAMAGRGGMLTVSGHARGVELPALGVGT